MQQGKLRLRPLPHDNPTKQEVRRPCTTQLNINESRNQQAAQHCRSTGYPSRNYASTMSASLMQGRNTGTTTPPSSLTPNPAPTKIKSQSSPTRQQLTNTAVPNRTHVGHPAAPAEEAGDQPTRAGGGRGYKAAAAAAWRADPEGKLEKGGRKKQQQRHDGVAAESSCS